MNQRKFAISMAFCLLLGNIIAAQELKWESDVDLAKNRAAKESKLVMLHFTADWCRPCQQLKTFVFSSPTVIAAVQERFVPVMVDTDANPELVKQYDVTSIPLDIVITSEGRVIQKRQSPKDSDNFLRMLKAVDNADTQYAMRNAVISRKIGQVLQEIEQGTPSGLSQHNDFAVKAPELARAQPSKEGQQLLAKSNTRLVDHVSEATEKQSLSSDPSPAAVTAVGPQRVINDRFFAEKSHAAQQVNQAVETQSKLTQPAPTTTPNHTTTTPNHANQFVSTMSATQAAPGHPGNQDREPMAIPRGGEFIPSAAPKTLPPTSSAVQPTPSAKPPTGIADNEFNSAPSTARLLNQKVEVPGKIEVEAVKQHLAAKHDLAVKQDLVPHSDQSANAARETRPDVSAKIVSAEKDVHPPADPRYPNTLRNPSLTTPNLVRGGLQDGLRDSVQQMFNAENQQSVKRSPQRPSRMGLGGKCPVTLVQNGKWVLGDKKFGCVHRGRTYLFADASKRASFQAEPEKFSPVLAGFDPVVFHDQGELVEGEEKYGVFMGKAPDHRIVLFRSQASRDQFQSNPKKYMATVRMAIQQSDSMR